MFLFYFQKHRSKQEYDFDLRDPLGHFLSSEYQPLHDPHLKAHFNTNFMRRHLVRKGFISRDGKVLCSLKEFNQYRQYLRHVFFLKISKERCEEVGLPEIYTKLFFLDILIRVIKYLSVVSYIIGHFNKMYESL